MKKVLLIEDNEISLRFIADAIALLPVLVDECRSFSEAKIQLAQNQYNLIISDINLGDGTLYQQAQWLPLQVKKIAMSAEISPSISERLQAMGINSVLAKPISISAIHHALIQQLDLETTPEKEPAIWDDGKALAALGNNTENLKSLKNLFKAELPQMMQQIDVEYRMDNQHKIVEILHKLKASCGFLGANKLLAECFALEQDICLNTITHFMLVANQTLDTI